MSKRRGAPDGDVAKHFQILERLLGTPKRQGKWTMFKCPCTPKGKRRTNRWG